jgi:hypothetical protein
LLYRFLGADTNTKKTTTGIGAVKMSGGNHNTCGERTRGHRPLLSKTREAHPITAAERRQIIAPGRKPGVSLANETISTVGATNSFDSFAPTGLRSKKRYQPTGFRVCCPTGGVAIFPLLSEEGWLRDQEKVAELPWLAQTG